MIKTIERTKPIVKTKGTFAENFSFDLLCTKVQLMHLTSSMTKENFVDENLYLIERKQQ